MLGDGAIRAKHYNEALLGSFLGLVCREQRIRLAKDWERKRGKANFLKCGAPIYGVQIHFGYPSTVISKPFGRRPQADL